MSQPPASERVASIDIGTNTVLLLVAERAAGGSIEAVVERATITRLGQGVDRTGQLSPEAVERTLRCLRSYAEEIRSLGVSKTLAVGTSAMRDARGGGDFAERAEAILGVRPRVISGEEEARLTFSGALLGLEVEGPLLVFDVGGGSTEVIQGEKTLGASSIRASNSLPLGSVRLTERWVKSDPPTEHELSTVRGEVRAALARLVKPPSGSTVVGVAGTVTTLASVLLGVEDGQGSRVHGSKLTLSEVTFVVERLGSLSLRERLLLKGLAEGRADVIVAGGLLALELLLWSGAPGLVVSDRGVRWGVAEGAIFR